MSDQPKKQIQDLLEAWTAETRNLPEPPLHPATRRMLQEEVSRVYPQRAKQGKTSLLGRFWPQFAFAGALGAVLIVGLIWNRDAKKDMQMASASKNERLKDESVVPGLNTLPATSPPPALASPEQSDVYATGPVEQTTALFSASPPANADLAVVDAGLASSPRNTTGRTEKLMAQAPQEPEVLEKRETQLPVMETSTGNVLSGGAAPNVNRIQPVSPVQLPFQRVASEKLTNLGAALRTYFVQITNNAPILSTFNVEQLGNELRIIDIDGSTYIGTITPQSEPEGTRQLATTSASSTVPARQRSATLPTASELNFEDAAVYNFAAQGTNRTLHTGVVLEGKYIARTNLTPGIAGIAPEPIRPTARLPGRGPSPGLNLRKSKAAIIGSAKFGTNQLEIKALAPIP